MGFKPIFEEERQFFKEKTEIELPTECWRNGSKIYLDFTQPKPLIEFKVENGKINITKDRRNGYVFSTGAVFTRTYIFCIWNW